MQPQLSPYEIDIHNQVPALKAQISYALPNALNQLRLEDYDRIILSGMGSSDYVTIPVERALLEAGYPVWRIDAGKLLDSMHLVTPGSLLWLTSQSGMSGEIVVLLEKLEGENRPATIIGVTNNENSTLARKSDIMVALKSGSEATVSSKSYINTLVAQYRIFLALSKASETELLNAIEEFTTQLAAIIDNNEPVKMLSDELFIRGEPRMALIGIGADGTTAMTGALILKEASKMMAEGYLGGEFRHGPIETSGPGMLAVLIGQPGNETLSRLEEELAQNGTMVVTIGPEPYGESQLLAVDTDNETLRLIAGILYIQHMTVAFAKAKNLQPGKFLFGQKITQKI